MANFSGQIENLIVTPSRHLFLLKSGEVEWQKEQIETSLSKVTSGVTSERDVMFHFVLKDTKSSLIYAESHPLSRISSIESFLYNGWRKKKMPGLLYGYPDSLMVTANTLKLFPSINIFSEKAGIPLIRAQEGEGVGVDAVKVWEKYLVSLTGFDYRLNYPEYIQSILSFNQRVNRESSMERDLLWERGLTLRERPLKQPPQNFEKFVDLFVDEGSKYNVDIFEETYDCTINEAFLEGDEELNEQKFGLREIKLRSEMKTEQRKLLLGIKKRWGYRFLEMSGSRIFVVYNTLESLVVMPKDGKDWYVECEEHRTKKFTDKAKDAIAMAKEGTFCEKCLVGMKVSQND